MYHFPISVPARIPNPNANTLKQALERRMGVQVGLALLLAFPTTSARPVTVVVPWMPASMVWSCSTTTRRTGAGWTRVPCMYVFLLMCIWVERDRGGGGSLWFLQQVFAAMTSVVYPQYHGYMYACNAVPRGVVFRAKFIPLHTKIDARESLNFLAE